SPRWPAPSGSRSQNSRACCSWQLSRGGGRMPTTVDRGDGYLFTRGKTFWLGYYHHGKYLRESLRTSDPQKAERLRKQKLKLVNPPHWVAREEKKVTLGDGGDSPPPTPPETGPPPKNHPPRHIRRLRGYFALDHALDITPDRIRAYTAARLDE